MCNISIVSNESIVGNVRIVRNVSSVSDVSKKKLDIGNHFGFKLHSQWVSKVIRHTRIGGSSK